MSSEAEAEAGAEIAAQATAKKQKQWAGQAVRKVEQPTSPATHAATSGSDLRLPASVLGMQKSAQFKSSPAALHCQRLLRCS